LTHVSFYLSIYLTTPNHQKWRTNFKNGMREFNFIQEISVLNKSYLCHTTSITSQCPRYVKTSCRVQLQCTI